MARFFCLPNGILIKTKGGHAMEVGDISIAKEKLEGNCFDIPRGAGLIIRELGPKNESGNCFCTVEYPFGPDNKPYKLCKVPSNFLITK